MFSITWMTIIQKSTGISHTVIHGTGIPTRFLRNLDKSILKTPRQHTGFSRQGMSWMKLILRNLPKGGLTMTIIKDIEATDFESDSWCCEDFWGKIHSQNLEDAFNAYMEDIFPQGVTETAFNDALRYDGDQILRDLGYTDEEE